MAGVLNRQGLVVQCVAEFAGTLILLLFGAGVVAQVGAAGLGDHDSIAWAWGLGVVFGVYTAARVSGAHLNPAVTLALAAFGKFPWRNVIAYWAAQVLGAFTGALLVRWVYNTVLVTADPGHTLKTQTVFSTLPGNGTLPISLWGAFLDQIVGTAILMFLIFALSDRLNDPPLSNLAPFMVGLIVVAIGMAWGTNAGYAINPARDFGPRLASYLTGYSGAWRDQYGGLYWWVPIVAPLMGGLIGALCYQLLIGRVLPNLDTAPPAGRGGDVEQPPDGGRQMAPAGEVQRPPGPLARNDWPALDKERELVEGEEEWRISLGPSTRGPQAPDS